MITTFHSVQELWLASQPGRVSDDCRSLGAKESLRMNVFAKIHLVLFYCSDVVNWHTYPPSAEMTQRHTKGLWQKVFLLGHLGSSAWEGIWLTLNMMPSARSIHFSFPICVIRLLCTHSKWQTTCMFYLLKRNSQLGWLWSAGLLEGRFLLDIMLFS